MRLTFVPVWEEQVEAAHMMRVSQEMSTLKSEVDKAVENRTVVPVSTPLSLGRPASGGIFSTGAQARTLTFTAEDKPVRTWAHRLQVVQRNSTLVVSADEDWQAVGGLTSISDVSEVLNFRLRIDEIGKNHNDDAITVQITDGNGAFAGSFQVEQHKDPPDTDLFYNVTNADGVKVYANAIAIHGANKYSPWWVDLLAPEYRFDRVLAVAAPPLTFDVVEAGFEGDFAITYLLSDGSGAIVGGGGVEIEEYNASFSGGTLRFVGENTYYVRQDYVLENGGLILRQGDAAVFKAPPAVTAGLSGSQASLRLSLPVLAGNDLSVSTEGPALAQTTPERPQFLLARATNLTLELTTDYPSLWASHLTDQLTAAGMDAGTEFDVTTTATTVKLDLWGPVTDPASEVFDISYRFSQSYVNLDVIT